MTFYPNDKVRINLDTSNLHGLEGIVINPTDGKIKVRITDEKGETTEYWYWDDEVILIERANT